MILRWNIGLIPIVSVTIVTPVEVVVAVVITISDIMTLSVVITIVSTLVYLTLALIFLIRALGVWSETPRLIIHYIGIFFKIVLI